MPNWLTVLLTATVVSALVTAPAIWLSHRTGIVAVPGGRRQHSGRVPKLGGLPVFAGLLAAWLLAWFVFPTTNPDDRLHILGMAAGTVFITLFGFIDDRLDLKPGPQFAGQAVAALIAVATSVFIERFTNPLNGQLVVMPLWLVVPITTFWIMGMVNTVNWLDGLDGLATGVAAIAALLFALHMYRLNQPTVALYAIALVGACLGFLPFNISPARIFLGGGGAMLLGFTLATLSILAPARYATALLVMAVPITDTAFLIIDRWRRGRSPLESDRGHLHYRLLDRGIPQRRIVFGYWLLAALFGGLSLVVGSFAKLLFLIAVVAAVLIVLAWLSTRTAIEEHPPG